MAPAARMAPVGPDFRMGEAGLRNSPFSGYDVVVA
jgi:hypothetical protein